MIRLRRKNSLKSKAKNTLNSSFLKMWAVVGLVTMVITIQFICTLGHPNRTVSRDQLDTERALVGSSCLKKMQRIKLTKWSSMFPSVSHFSFQQLFASALIASTTLRNGLQLMVKTAFIWKSQFVPTENAKYYFNSFLILNSQF